MVIVFEPLLQDDALYEQLAPACWLFLAEVKKHIEHRLHPLREEIDQEEQATSATDLPACILLQFHPAGIVFIRYSDPLRKKMQACFPDFPAELRSIAARFNDPVATCFPSRLRDRYTL